MVKLTRVALHLPRTWLGVVWVKDICIDECHRLCKI
jgi:hypothetical protein